VPRRHSCFQSCWPGEATRENLLEHLRRGGETPALATAPCPRSMGIGRAVGLVRASRAASGDWWWAGRSETAAATDAQGIAAAACYWQAGGRCMCVRGEECCLGSTWACRIVACEAYLCSSNRYRASIALMFPNPVPRLHSQPRVRVEGGGICGVRLGGDLRCECSMMRDKGAPATGRARLLVVRRLSTPQGISPSSLNSSYGDLCIPTTAMVQLKDDTPTLKEALKQDRAQYDDCTPCRIVGMMFRRFCLSTTFAQTLYMFGESLFIILLIHLDRKCHLRGARRLHLRVRPLPDQS
jgi:hypothetical protein